MPRIASGLVACFLIFSACLSAVELKGKITDQSGAPIPGAQVALVNRVGVVAQTTAGAEWQLSAGCSANSGHAAGGHGSRISDAHAGAR